MKILLYDDFNGIIPPKDKQQYVGSITTMWGRNAFRAGWKIIEIWQTKEESGTKESSSP